MEAFDTSTLQIIVMGIAINAFAGLIVWLERRQRKSSDTNS